MSEAGDEANAAPPAWARRSDVQPSGWQQGDTAGPRLTIVGPCAAGKTTLVANLRARGLDAHAVAQEHSGVAYLWQLSEPDLLIFLDVDLATTAVRRRREWPASLYETQQGRLAHARAHTDFYLDGSKLTPEEVAERVADFAARSAPKAKE
jgi:hypothetical protein